MFPEILSEKTRGSLEILNQTGILNDFYLAGGTGLALQLKHRFSFDLDFFTEKTVDSKSLIQKMEQLGRISVEKESENTLVGQFGETRISFFKYDYPVLEAFKDFQGLKVADARDIGCMKISAASSRGAKKDFIDLYFICLEVVPLAELLNLFEKKYQTANYNMVHIFKSLTYFEDAEKDPMPAMIKPVSWKEVGEFFRTEVRKTQLLE